MIDRIRWWWAGDRVKKIAVVESRVMGQDAVTWHATLVFIAGLLQLTRDAGSALVGMWGGVALSYAWSVSLLLGAMLIWMARWIGRRYDAADLEIAGIALLAVGAGTYVLALFKVGDPDNAGYVLAYIIGSTTNSLARAWLLRRRARGLVRGVR